MAELIFHEVPVAAQWLLINKALTLDELVATLQRGPGTSTAEITSRVRREIRLLALDIGREVLTVGMLTHRCQKRCASPIESTAEIKERLQDPNDGLLDRMLPPGWAYVVADNNSPSYYFNQNDGTSHEEPPPPLADYLDEIFDGRVIARATARRRIDRGAVEGLDPTEAIAGSESDSSPPDDAHNDLNAAENALNAAGRPRSIASTWSSRPIKAGTSQ